MISSFFGSLFTKRVGSRFAVQGRYLPASIRAKLLYAKPAPSSGDWEAPIGDWEATSGDTDYSAHKLPGKTDPAYASVYAAVNDGSGFWYDGNGDPVAHLVSEILAEIRTNTWNIWCNSRGRLMVFAKTLFYSEAAIVERYLLGVRPAVNAPPTTSDVVLHYDAEKSELAELTGGASPLNHSVLSPQYERQSDGSYVNVGARPAVDTFADGFVGLRSCGAVTNLAAATLTKDSSATLTNGWYNLSTCVDGVDAVFTSYTGSLATDASKPFTGFFICEFLPEDVGKKIKYIIKRNYGTYVATTSEHTIVSGLNTLAPLTFTQAADGYGARIVINKENDSGYATIIKPIGWMITQSSYPTPYVPQGVTQPASNATTTNGSWFANPLDSDLWKSLTGSPLTLATRIRMGVGSADLPKNTSTNAMTCASSGGTVLMARDVSGSKYPSASSDGINSALPTAVIWTRNAIVRRCVQVSTAGTQFRVGYMIEGTHTVPQWGSWTTFDGSFDPSNLYRLILGYSNEYPMWFNKITVWKRQVPDEELSVAWL